MMEYVGYPCEPQLVCPEKHPQKWRLSFGGDRSCFNEVKKAPNRSLCEFGRPNLLGMDMVVKFTCLRKCSSARFRFHAHVQAV